VFNRNFILAFEKKISSNSLLCIPLEK